jgi:hypothetical protein
VEAAKIYLAIYWYSMLQIPGADVGWLSTKN